MNWEALGLLLSALIFCGLGVGAAVYGGSHWLSRWYFAYEHEYTQRAEQDLYGMFSNMPPQRVFQWSLGCFGGVFGVCFLFFGRFDTKLTTVISLLISLILGSLAFLLPRVVLKRASILRLRRFDLQLLDALLTMSNALKAGFSIIQAFESVVQEGKNPISQEFDLFLREIRLGAKFETASQNLSKRMPTEDLQIVLLGIETARQTGGNLTEVFDRLASVIRERMRVQGRIRALTAQGRLQGWAVGSMPLVMGVAVYFIEPGMMLSFVNSPLGMLLIFIMISLEAVGFYIIRKIVNIDV